MANTKKIKAQPTEPSQNTSQFDELRVYYFSLSEKDRDEVIEVLGQTDDAKSSRELTQLFQDCLWRETRFKILSALSNHQHFRSIEFLIKTAQNTQDLQMANHAIEALGNCNSLLSKRFLAAYYSTATEALKPCIIQALGQSKEPSILNQILLELSKTQTTENRLLEQNIVFYMGELRFQSATPLLEKMIESKIKTYASSARQQIDFSDSQLAQLLLSYSNIARNTGFLTKIIAKNQNDPQLTQALSAAISQVLNRSQWLLEDYLKKALSTKGVSSTLLLEFNTFNAEALKSALLLFAQSDIQPTDTLVRLLDLLKHLTDETVGHWYLELIPQATLSSFDEKLWTYFLHSIAHHQTASAESTLNQVYKTYFKNFSEGLKSAFFEAAQFTCRAHQNQWSTPTLITFATHQQSNLKEYQAVVQLLEQRLFENAQSEEAPRLIRGLGDLHFRSSRLDQLILGELKNKPIENKSSALLHSYLYYLARNSDKLFFSALIQLVEVEKDLAMDWSRTSLILQALTEVPQMPVVAHELDALLQRVLESKNDSTIKVALRLLQRHARPSFFDSLLLLLNKNSTLTLEALATIKICKPQKIDPTSIKAIAKHLKSNDPSIKGRALDTLCSYDSATAHQLLLDSLEEHFNDLDWVDKIARTFSKKSGAGKLEVSSTKDSFEQVNDLITTLTKKFPDHDAIENLVRIRDSFLNPSNAVASEGGQNKTKRLSTNLTIDHKIKEKLKSYDLLDDSTRSALRSAEMPFIYPDLFDESIDKSSSILGYCKTVDLILEKELGKKKLFPRIESQLHEFQNTVFRLGLQSDRPHPTQTLQALGLENQFSAQSFPLHKAAQVAQSILSGKIVNDHFKSLDGLRAWAVIFLIYTRTLPLGQGDRKPLIRIESISDSEIVTLSKKLMALQDIRNPVAHRQTIIARPQLNQVREEIFGLLNLLEKVFF